MNEIKWINKNCDNLSGKRVVVTGATGGLGREICFFLAHLQADITIACRNKILAEQLIYEIKQKYSSANIDFVELDLNNIKSVKNCINNLKKYKGIDVLINNAGVYNVPVKKMESGFNNIFQINFAYTYYFTKELLYELEKNDDSICITVSSIAYKYSKINEKDIDHSSRKRASKIYGNSKRFLMLSLYELFKNSKVNMSIVHPGITLTNMTSHYPKFINWLIKIGVKLLFANPRKASLNILYGTNHATKYHEWIGPRVFGIWGRPKISKVKSCSIEETNKIFEIAERIYNKINNKK